MQINPDLAQVMDEWTSLSSRHYVAVANRVLRTPSAGEQAQSTRWQRRWSPRGSFYTLMNANGLFRLNHCDAIDTLAFGLDLNPCPRMNDTGVDCPTFGIDVADLFR